MIKHEGGFLKKSKVCKGCKYLLTGKTSPMQGCCDYLSVTGKSRLMYERKHGGYKVDSCVCYEKGKQRKVSPYGKTQWNEGE